MLSLIIAWQFESILNNGKHWTIIFIAVYDPYKKIILITWKSSDSTCFKTWMNTILYE